MKGNITHGDTDTVGNWSYYFYVLDERRKRLCFIFTYAISLAFIYVNLGDKVARNVSKECSIMRNSYDMETSYVVPEPSDLGFIVILTK